jgi:deoxyribodipyrimidine photolyase
MFGRISQKRLIAALPIHPRLPFTPHHFIVRCNSELFPGSFADRNNRFARRLLDSLNTDAAKFSKLKQVSSQYRKGNLSPENLCTAFLTELQDKSICKSLLLDLAELMPTSVSRAQLIMAADDAIILEEEEEEGKGTLGQPSSYISASQTTNKDTVPNINKKDKNEKNGRKSKKHKGNLAPHHQDGNIIVWLRQDLRLHDNPALQHAATDVAGNIYIVYIHSEEEDEEVVEGSWPPGGASKLWKHWALDSLDSSLQGKYGPGAAIMYIKGKKNREEEKVEERTMASMESSSSSYGRVLLQLAEELHATSVYYNKQYEPWHLHRDAAVNSVLRNADLNVKSFNALLIREPWDVKIDMNKWRGHFGTLMPYYKAWEKSVGCRSSSSSSTPLPVPKTLAVASEKTHTSLSVSSLNDLGLARMPPHIDWGSSIKEWWGDVSEQGALNRLDAFLNERSGVDTYEANKGFADGRGITQLSPYIHFGQLSPRTLMKALKSNNCKTASPTLYRRLVWRDLTYWQLYHWPTLANQPLRRGYADIEWRDDSVLLKAWQQGQTGFPLVDAGMRQLWKVGYIQQNARMAVALFLTEYMHINWVHGARWFHDTLVDADLAINSSSWQNAGKSGLDGWNFSVSPVSRAQDPDGSYIITWVPELALLPVKYRHQPWKASDTELQAAGVHLGVTYPHRIIGDSSLEELKEVNTMAIRAAREKHHNTIDQGGYDLIKVPINSTSSGHDGTLIRVFTKKEYR